MSSINLDHLTRIAEMANVLFPTTFDYRKTLPQACEADGLHYLDGVVLWAPGSGEDAFNQAVTSVLLSLPDTYIEIYISSRFNKVSVKNRIEACLSVLEDDVDYFDRTKVAVVGGSHEERLDILGRRLRLPHLRPNHVVVYGSDGTCREVLQQVDPLTPRTVYGSKTSLGLLYDPTPELLAKHFKDAVVGGGAGCLNTTTLYTTPLEDRGVVYQLFRAVKDACGVVTDPRVVDDLRLEFVRNGTSFTSVDEEDGSLIFRNRDYACDPTFGIGEGTLVIVEDQEPLQALRSEWGERGRLLSTVALDDYYNRPYDVEVLSSLGVSRFCRAGMSQYPDHNWKHDGGDVFPFLFKKVRGQ